MDNPFRVSLSSKTRQPPYGYNKVTFEVSPEFVETRTVNYSSIDPVHMPGNIYVYKNTQARTFSISGAKLLSRTPDEAENTLSKLWMLRGWTMPRFGINSVTSSDAAQNKMQQWQQESTKNSTANQSIFTDAAILQSNTTGELLGSPPEVLYVSAYASRDSGSAAAGEVSTNTTKVATGFRGNIKRVPVVISSLSIPYPTDVDYIISGTSKVPVPIIMSIDISLLEAHSANEYEQFSLDNYKQGILTGF